MIMSQSNNRSKKHHYVPQFYMRYFSSTNKNDLSVLIVTEKGFYLKDRSSPKSICFTEDLHTLSDDYIDAKFYEIEDYYSKIESEINKLMMMINITLNKKQAINNIIQLDDMQVFLKFFISFMFWRNPNQQPLVRDNIQYIRKYYDESYADQKEFFNNDRNFIKYLEKKYKRLLKKNRKTEKYVKRLDMLIKTFHFIFFPILGFNLHSKINLKIQILSSEKYISNDNPILTLGTFEETKNSQKIIFPLTSNILIFSEDIDIRNYSVKQINEMIAKNANKYIYGDLDILKELKVFLEQNKDNQ